MRFAILLASLAAALIINTPSAAAQSRSAVLAPAAPLPAALSPAPSDAASRPTTEIAPRSRFRYPTIGLLAGAAVGAVVGTYVMATSDEWIGAPAHILTVPAGALLGLAVGALANPPARR
ncbi:hypothetical protein [Longimicrobium sp.]|uniref:hypothetical protein n=1 Tax=Longimicrobium sp. TaxID=2029185 RepID=UPI002E333D16|nr:hypothetical protein [Longimicrobium sp.]HEX6039680.1 hypothetical protein [Longimicrobium sp.]